MIKKALISAILISLPYIGWSDQVAVSKFGLLDNNSPSVSLDNSQAQDLLNVDVSAGGGSVEKRSGYGTYKALATAKPMRGGYHSFNATGDDVQIWGSSTSLYGIVADGTPTQLISSATLNSTWDCADTQGFNYCVNSSRDAYIKTNGATITWYTTPLGTMVETTPDRVIVAGVSGSPNTLFVSQSNTFTNYTTGVNATDAFTEVIASPGSHITHIRWGCGKILWWKDASFGYFDFDDQFTAQVKTVSDVIGTFDNTSAIDPGGRVWFRGQDGHTWMYDCSVLTKQSVDITPNVQASGKRTSNLWTQTSQSDWQAGGIIPTGYISTTISPGDVTVSSFQAVENSTAQWNSGSVVNTTVGTSSVSLAINNSGNINDNDFEGTYSTNFTGTSVSFNTCDSICGTGGQSGSSWAETLNNGNCGACGGSCGNDSPVISSLSFSILDQNGIGLSTTSLTLAASCSWTQQVVSNASLKGSRVKYRFTLNGLSAGMTTKSTFIYPGTVSFYYRCPRLTGLSMRCEFDNVQGGSSTVTTGSYTSQVYDTGFTSSTYQLQSFWTVNTTTPTIALMTSASSGGPFTTLLTSTGTNAVGNRYAKYSSTISITATDNAATYISSSVIISRSTGTFYSAVKNAPNLTAWSTFGPNLVLNGGTETFYIRASTIVFSVLSTTPTWVAQSVGGLVSASTGTFFQVRDDFAITAATQSPTLNDFSINWFEGSATDQAYMLYFDNAIWESVAFGSGQSTNNYIFKYDLINDGWTLYNFGAGGLLQQANTLYFGDTSLGNIFNFGTSTSDNGTAINAYWRSKTFTGADPFLQNQLTNIDTLASADAGTTLTGTYTVETSTGTSYSISLSTTTQTLIQSRKLLPSGKLGYSFDMKYGDTSASSSWELLGFRIGFITLPYKPTQP